MSAGWVSSGSKSLVGTTDTGSLVEDLLTRQNFSTILGYQAGKKIVGGIGNTIVGYQAALESTLANNFIAIGRYAGKDNQGSDVIYIGNNTGGTFGGNNVVVGHDAATEAGRSEFNVIVGNQAFRNYTGYFNVAIGYRNDKSDPTRVSQNNTSLGALTEAYGTNNVVVGFRSKTGDASNAYLVGTDLSNSGSDAVLLGTRIENSGDRVLIVGHGTGFVPLSNARDDYVNIMGMIEGTRHDGLTISSCNTTLTTPDGLAGISLSNGTVHVLGQALFSSNVELASDLSVQGQASFDGLVQVQGDDGLQVLVGPTELASLEVHDLAHFGEDVLMSADLEVEGRLTVRSNALFEGQELGLPNGRILAKDMLLSGDLRVQDGTASFCNLAVRGDAEFSGGARFTGPQPVTADELRVDVHAQLCNATVTGRLRLDGELDVGCRPLHICTLHADTFVASNSARFLQGFRNEGPAVFEDLADFKRGFMVSNACLFNSDLYVTGLLDVKSNGIFHRDVHILENLDVGGATFVHSNLSIDGELSVAAATRFNEGVNFHGPAEFTSDVKVIGDLTGIASAAFGTNVDVGGDLVVQQDAEVFEDLWLRGRLGVSNYALLRSNVYVGQDLQVDGNITVNREAIFKMLRVFQGATFQSNVTVDGVVQMLPYTDPLLTRSAAVRGGDATASMTTSRALPASPAPGRSLARFTADVDVQAHMYVTEGVHVASNVVVLGYTDVLQNSVYSNDLTVLGNLNVRNMQIPGNFSAASIDIAQTAIFRQGLDSLGPATFRCNVEVRAPATFCNEVKVVEAPLTASGSVFVGGGPGAQLHVAAPATFQGPLTSCNQATFAGPSDFRSNVEFQQLVTLVGPTSAQGPVQLAGPATFLGGLTACNDATFATNVNVLGTLESRQLVADDLTVNGNLRLNGSNLLQVLNASSNWTTGVFTSNVYMQSTLTVDGVTRINNDLYVKTLYADLLSTRTRLSVDQVGGFNNDVTFLQNSTVLGDQYIIGSLYANSDVSVDGRLRTYGDFQLTNDSNSWTISIDPASHSLDFTSIRGTQVSFSELFETGVLNHTGQHRCRMELTSREEDNETTEPPAVGSVVSSTGRYFNNILGKPNVHIDDCIPVVRTAARRRDTKVFGVISRVDAMVVTGAAAGPYSPPAHVFRVGHVCFKVPRTAAGSRSSSTPDARHHRSRGGGHDVTREVDVVINQTGEGCILVCDELGSVRNGDLLCVSSVPGVCMRQGSKTMRSYTCAKATCDQRCVRSYELVYGCKRYNVALVGCIYKF